MLIMFLNMEEARFLDDFDLHCHRLKQVLKNKGAIRTYNRVPDIELSWRWCRLLHPNTPDPIVPRKTLQFCLHLVSVRPQTGYPAVPDLYK